MNMKEFFEKKMNFDKERLNIFSRLLVNTTLNFFVAVVVFSAASFILLPQIFVHQEKEIEELRREIRALKSKETAPEEVLPAPVYSEDHLPDGAVREMADEAEDNSRKENDDESAEKKSDERTSSSGTIDNSTGIRDKIEIKDREFGGDGGMQNQDEDEGKKE